MWPKATNRVAAICWLAASRARTAIGGIALCTAKSPFFRCVASVFRRGFGGHVNHGGLYLHGFSPEHPAFFNSRPGAE